MKISIISALARNRVIGLQNCLTCHLPADLAHFKKLTLNKPVLMGRTTFESIGKPLPNRDILILSKDKNYSANGCKVFTDIKDVLNYVEGKDELMIAGGSSIYRQLLPIATHMHLTFIDLEIEGDTYFPDFHFYEWKEINREYHSADEKNPFDYCFVDFDRVRSLQQPIKTNK